MSGLFDGQKSKFMRVSYIIDLLDCKQRMIDAQNVKSKTQLSDKITTRIYQKMIIIEFL